MIIVKNIFLILVLVQLLGCSAIYEDISHSSEYAHLINTKYMNIHEMAVMGNLSDNLNKKSIYSYTITPKPGYSGRYVVRQEPLRAGKIIKFKKIMRCTNCLFSNINIEIETQLSKNNNLPIKIQNRFMNDVIIIKNRQGKNVVNPKILTETKSNKIKERNQRD